MDAPEVCRWIGVSGDVYLLNEDGDLHYRADPICGEYELTLQGVTREEAAQFVLGQGEYRSTKGDGKIKSVPKERKAHEFKNESEADLTPEQRAEVNRRIELHRRRVSREMFILGIDCEATQQMMKLQSHWVAFFKEAVQKLPPNESPTVTAVAKVCGRSQHTIRWIMRRYLIKHADVGMVKDKPGSKTKESVWRTSLSGAVAKVIGDVTPDKVAVILGLQPRDIRRILSKYKIKRGEIGILSGEKNRFR